MYNSHEKCWFYCGAAGPHIILSHSSNWHLCRAVYLARTYQWTNEWNSRLILQYIRRRFITFPDFLNQQNTCDLCDITLMFDRRRQLRCDGSCQICMWFKEDGTFAKTKISLGEKLMRGALVILKTDLVVTNICRNFTISLSVSHQRVDVRYFTSEILYLLPH